MSKVIPILKYLRADVWTGEHWSELFYELNITRKDVTISNLKVQELLDKKDLIVSLADVIKNLNSRAQGEILIREALQELDVWGSVTRFSTTIYTTGQGFTLPIIKEWKELLTQLGDNQSLLQSLKDSPFYKRFIDRANAWESKLVHLDEFLKNLNSIQRKWIYLEPLFSRGSLPKEQSRFSRIDSDFKDILGFITKNQVVVSLCDYPRIKSTLENLMDQLEKCQKSLHEFLYEKRDAFPRFYFLGDEDLLEILGQSQNPLVIQSHLKKLFAGVYRVEFNSENNQIISLMSFHGEKIPLQRPIIVTDQVQLWLYEFTMEMKSTLSHLLNHWLLQETQLDIFKIPQQIFDLISNIQFTRQVESCITSKSDLNLLKESLQTQLQKYTSFSLEKMTNKIEKEITSIKIKSIIMDLIHQIDVVSQLIQAQVKSIQDWTWKKQLRFYCIQNSVKIKMNDAEFDYTFEYQGNYSKLVHTPLTDKCFLTLTQAMAAGFGGNPLGPAGIFLLSI